jgi:hypothetical protein
MNRLRSFLILLLVFTLLNQVYCSLNEEDDSKSENDSVMNPEYDLNNQNEDEDDEDSRSTSVENNKPSLWKRNNEWRYLMNQDNLMKKMMDDRKQCLILGCKNLKAHINKCLKFCTGREYIERYNYF